MNLSLGVYDPMNTNRARKEYKLGNGENVDGRERCGYCGPFSELECVFFFPISSSFEDRSKNTCWRGSKVQWFKPLDLNPG